ncbi:MAG TPA: hypothetical protein VKD72_26915 [Gemmataceae bacterium]|nr:hypothetical protein [Gemmataceae bacterium]
MSKHLVRSTVLLAGMIALQSQCGADEPAPNSKVTQNNPGVVEIMKDMQWRIDLSGTVTLGKNDEFKGFQVKLNEPPNGTGPERSPFFSSYTQPKAGETKNWTAYHFTNVKGSWKSSASLQYLGPDGTPGVAAEGKDFNVPLTF